VFRDALATALVEHLDVDADRLAVSVTLDGEPVPAVNLPVTLSLLANAPEDETPAPVVAAAPVEAAERPAGRSNERAKSAPSNAPERESVQVTPEELDQEAEAAADLLEGLLDAMDLPGDLRISVQEAHAEVEVIGLEEGVLIGRRGQTLEAVQELVRTAMQRRFERRSRVLVDVDGYRARRLEKLLERADEAVREVLASGEAQRLEPMDSIERRLVHQRVAETDGVVSNSHGREPSRRIVIEIAD
jgi:spoIIIJ-associated protein